MPVCVHVCLWVRAHVCASACVRVCVCREGAWGPRARSGWEGAAGRCSRCGRPEASFMLLLRTQRTLNLALLPPWPGVPDGLCEGG